MAFARVGTIGTAVQGAAGAGVSPGWGTGLSDHGHPPTVHEGPTVGTTIADQGTGGRATDGPRLTVGVDDG